ncbi:uncharacterized [Tachysurus ichikawai]
MWYEHKGRLCGVQAPYNSPEHLKSYSMEPEWEKIEKPLFLFARLKKGMVALNGYMAPLACENNIQETFLICLAIVHGSLYFFLARLSCSEGVSLLLSL